MELVPSSTHPTTSASWFQTPLIAATLSDSGHEERWVQSALHVIKSFGLQVSDAQVNSVRAFISTHRVENLSAEEAHAILVKKVIELAGRSTPLETVKLATTIQELPLSPLRDLLETEYCTPAHYRQMESYQKDKQERDKMFALVSQLPIDKQQNYTQAVALLLPTIHKKFPAATSDVIIHLMKFMLEHQKEDYLSLATALKPFLEHLTAADNIAKIAEVVLSVPPAKREELLRKSKPFLEAVEVDSKLCEFRHEILAFVRDSLFPFEKNKLEVMQHYLMQLPIPERKEELRKFLSLSSEKQERFITYCGSTPEGKRVDDLKALSSGMRPEGLDLRTLLAHQFTFSGISRVGGVEMDLTGAHTFVVHHHLQTDVNAFYREVNPLVASVLSKSVRHQLTSLKEVDAILAQDQVIALYGGWSGHAVGALIFKDGEDYILARCNKGGGSGNFPGIQFHKVGNPEALLLFINKFHSLQKEDFVEAPALQLGSCSFPYIAQQYQKVGNCTVANYHSLERAILYVLERKKGAPHALASRRAQEMHQKRARSSALNSLERYLEQFVGGKNREKLDPVVIGNLFMKLPMHRKVGSYEWTRLAMLERWLYQGDFSPEEFKILKDSVDVAQDRGAAEKEGTDSGKHMLLIWDKIERAQKIIAEGKKEEAIRALDLFLTPGRTTTEMKAAQLELERTLEGLAPSTAPVTKLKREESEEAIRALDLFLTPGRTTTEMKAAQLELERTLEGLAPSTAPVTKLKREESMDDYLARFLLPQKRTPADLDQMIKLWVSAKREMGLDDIAKLESLLYQADLSREEYRHLRDYLKQAIKASTIFQPYGDEILQSINRAERIITAERKDDALRALNKFIGKKSEKSGKAPTFKRLEEKLRSLDPKEGTGPLSRFW